ncbi:MAG TPA: aspartyl protease family protein [Bacteroidota bacterium]|nr:aspartyl protease family protein [Bacteroidota bacterium]
MKRFFVVLSVFALALTWTASAQNVYGEMKLVYDQGYVFAESSMPDGGTAWFAVDLAVNVTSVSKAWIGDRAVIQKPQGRRDASEGKTYFALGGVGFVGDVVGKATLPVLNVGGLVFPQTSVSVLENAPTVAGRSLSGIIGTDLLRRAEIALFRYGATPTLQLKSKASPMKQALSLPMTVSNGFIVVKGEMQGKPVDVILDNGSPESYFPVATLRAVGAAAVPNSTRDITDPEGNVLKVRASNVSGISLGGTEFEAPQFHIAELGVFTRVPGVSSPVLLGNSFFSTVQAVEINFSESTVRVQK